MPDNYYERLGVKRESDFSEIRKAYRALVLEIHPDRNPLDETAKDKFQNLMEAYEVLSDPKKRLEYDLTLPSKAQNIPPAVFSRPDIWDRKGKVSSRKSLAFLYEQNINAFKSEDAWRGAFLALITVFPVWNFFSENKFHWWWSPIFLVLLYLVKPVTSFLFVTPFVKEAVSFFTLSFIAKIFLGEGNLFLSVLTGAFVGSAMGAATGRAFYQASSHWQSKALSVVMGGLIGFISALFLGFCIGMFRAVAGVQQGFFNELFATALSGAIASLFISFLGTVSEGEEASAV